MIEIGNWLLDAINNMFWYVTITFSQLAHAADSLSFMSNQATQAAINKRWYGHLSSSTTNFRVSCDVEREDVVEDYTVLTHI